MLNVRVEAIYGTILETICESIELSRALTTLVNESSDTSIIIGTVFEFNGVEVSVDLTSDPHEVLQEYKDDISNSD